MTVQRPPGTTPGGVLILSIQASDASTSIATPPGWTSVYSIAATYGTNLLAYRVAAAGDPSSYTVDLGESRTATAVLGSWRGVDPAQPIDTYSNWGRYSRAAARTRSA